MLNNRKKFLILAGLVVSFLVVSLSNGNSADDLSKGMLLYQANCFSCHGIGGDGNGPEAIQFDPKPTNFTAAQMASVPNSTIEKAIVEGVPKVTQHSWGGILSAEDIEALIKAVRSFQK